MSTVDALKQRLLELKKERRAIILAHYYQRDEIQEVADFIGDSFGLSQRAAATDAEVIVFCGVHFMAESAAILSPDKIVLLPEPRAGCPMANMVDVEGLRALKAQHPDAAVVSYVNTTAAVKAESDICCTSSNAVKVVNSLDAEKIIFTPDRNLGRYVAQHTDKQVIVWEGYCHTHDHLTLEQFEHIKAQYPQALTVVHPECRPEVSAAADHVASTAGMLKFVRESEATQFIVGTEGGILFMMRQQNPDKKFYLASPNLICPNMKANTLEKTVRALEQMEPRITVPEEVRLKAVQALDRMLAIK
ncbi:MAG TPA: quinolinate synthase NadA [Firmicutes bacterium]|nr:quinolinate synthase NadA [Bacillota bacterium]